MAEGFLGTKLAKEKGETEAVLQLQRFKYLWQIGVIETNVFPLYGDNEYIYQLSLLVIEAILKSSAKRFCSTIGKSIIVMGCSSDPILIWNSFCFSAAHSASFNFRIKFHFDLPVSSTAAYE